MDKKGQLTMFIILGLVILLAISISIYFLQYSPEVPTVQIENDILPVYNAVFLCVNNLALEGVNKLGLQGGYLSVPSMIKNNPLARLDLTKSGSFSVPYWYYEGENRMPNLDQMQTELSVFIKNNLKECADFSSLSQFEIEEKGNITVNSFFGDQNVAVDVKWPLRIKTNNKFFDQENYRTELDVRLKKVHELAEKIMKSENKNEFLEKSTIALMSGNPNIPMDGMSNSCQPEKWRLKNVEQNFKELIKANLPHVRIMNTETLDFLLDEKEYFSLKKTNERINAELNALKEYDTSNPLSAVGNVPKNDAPDDAFDYNNLRFNVDTPSTSLQVGFYFNPDWKILFNAQPNDGGLLSSNVVRGENKFLKFLCVNNYHFTYDIIYPVLVSVRDSSAFDDAGFVYQFAFPILINNNHGDRKAFGLKRFVNPYFDSEYCDKKSDREVEFRALGFEQNVPIASELDDVSIEFVCGPKSCPLGETKSRRGSYNLLAQLPNCGNPFIKARKDSYLPEQKMLLSNDQELNFELTELKNLKIDLLIYEYDDYAQKLLDPVLMSARQNLLIYVSSPDHEDFQQYINYPEELTLDLMGKDSIYNFELFLGLKDLGTMLGGKVLENVKINYDEFSDKNTIVLKVLKPSLPSNDEERARMQELIYSTEFFDELRPEFK